ncbi:MAG: hypothetical protein AAF086_04745 [Planctomycetota bacterium]
MTPTESPDTISTDHEPTPTHERDLEAVDTHESPDTDKLVPVSEAIRYRKRAQTAEQQLNELRDRFTQLQTQLDSSQDTITSLERRQKIDALLTDSDAIDLEAARLLTEISVSQMDEPDVSTAVNDLRRQKPYLFRHRPRVNDSVMAPRVTPGAVLPAEQDAAQRAAATGDRRDLLDYLRLRRK